MEEGVEWVGPSPPGLAAVLAGASIHPLGWPVETQLKKPGKGGNRTLTSQASRPTQQLTAHRAGWGWASTNTQASPRLSPLQGRSTLPCASYARDTPWNSPPETPTPGARVQHTSYSRTHGKPPGLALGKGPKT